MNLWKKFKLWRAQRAIYMDNYQTVVGPASGAYFLLRAHKNDPDLNLATVRRAQEWCWNTFYYMGTNLGPYQKRAKSILEGLDHAIDIFPWVDAKYKTDYYTEVAHYFEKGTNS